MPYIVPTKDDLLRIRRHLEFFAREFERIGFQIHGPSLAKTLALLPKEPST